MRRLRQFIEVLRIALLLPLDIEYGRAVIRGVKAYVGPDRGWIFHVAMPDPRILATVRAWRPAGVIAHINRAELIRPLRRLNRPVINISNTLPNAPLPRVGLDNPAVGRMAARHYLERQLRHFAFVGFPDHMYVQERLAAYENALKQAGFGPVHIFKLPAASTWGGNWALRGQTLHRWMRSLPKPIGILAAHDQHAFELADVCRLVGLRVPDDVAILGVDNDELICQLATPPLSSIAGCGEQTGYEAAAMLHHCISGKSAPTEPLLLSPPKLVTRQSSDILAVTDADVQTAVRFIRSHSTQAISVTDVTTDLCISRRSLERKFQALLGHTILAEIRRVRLDNVKLLLAETDSTIAEIAARAGFGSPERLTITFRDCEGILPSEYRAKFRLRP
jgi:LacI family transcriptional regulator